MTPELLPTFRDPLSLPIGMDPDEAGLRQRAWALACAKGFPPLRAGMNTRGGEDWYANWCSEANVRDVQGILAALEAL